MPESMNPEDEALAVSVPDFDPRNSRIVADLYLRLLESWKKNREYRDYVRGKHSLVYATAKWKTEFGRLFGSLKNNYCRRVIETLADYVQFEEVETKSDAANARLKQWFDVQRFDAIQDRIHTDAFQYGETFGIMAPDPKKENELRFYRQSPGSMVGYYDPENPDRLLVALKLWRTLGNSWRLTIYTIDGIFRYESAKNRRVSGDLSNSTALAPASLRSFKPLEVEPFVPNLVEERLPVFHWQNIPEDDGDPVSELDDVIPLQDALNKLFADMMVASEFQSYRQRWVTGIEADIDEKTGKPVPLNLDNGPNRMLFSDDEKTKFGEFGVADLSNFLSAMSDLRMEIARVSRVPPHHLSMVENFPSGEALKTAEAPLQAKVQDRAKKWGNVYEDLAEYLLLATDATLAAAAKEYESEFCDTTPRSRKEEAEADEVEVTTATAKVKLGVSRAEALRELGYDDEKQKKMKEEKTKEATEDAATAQNIFMNEAPGGSFPAARPTVPGAAPSAPPASAPTAGA